jgi:hypothetical protein
VRQEAGSIAIVGSTTIAVEDGKLLAGVADGQFLPRKIDGEIRSRTAV